MEKEPKPGQPDDFNKEASEFFKKEDEKSVGPLHEALKINRAVELIAGYLKGGFLTHDMSLIAALEKLEKKKFELIEINPEETEEEGK